MKKVIITFVVLLAIVLSSCTALLAPSCAENEEVLIDVYNNTYRIMTEDAANNDYTGLVRLGLMFSDGGLSNVSQTKKINSVTMLEWCLNESMQGNSYTGYYVTYEVWFDDSRWYTLIDLTEFESGRYEWKVIDADRSLSAIQSMLY